MLPYTCVNAILLIKIAWEIRILNRNKTYIDTQILNKPFFSDILKNFSIAVKFTGIFVVFNKCLIGGNTNALATTLCEAKLWLISNIYTLYIYANMFAFVLKNILEYFYS